MHRALIASVTIGISCGLIGTYIMLRKMSLIGDALAHSVLPGVVISFMIAGKNELFLFFGAVISGITTSLLIGLVNRNSKIKEDTSIGIIFTGAFALGILLVSQLKQVHIDLSSYLFGDVLGVSDADIILSSVITLIIILSVILFYKQLLITSFDPTIAATIGVSVSLVHYLLMSLLSMSIVAGLQSVGVILIIAMLITPPAAAYLLTNSLKKILLLSALIGVISSVTGLYLSYHLNYSSGASIVLTSVVIFLLAFLFSPLEGLVPRYFRRRNSIKQNLMEDVMKIIYKNPDCSEKNKLFKICKTHLNINETSFESAIKRATRKNLLFEKNENLHLSELGEEISAKLLRSHRLWEAYAAKEKFISPEKIHPDAEKVEHILTDDLIKELDEELGYPETDPHGSPIPYRKKEKS